jgi:adenylate cyclase
VSEFGEGENMTKRSADELEALLALNALVDDLLEQSMQERRSLPRTLSLVLPAIAQELQAEAVFVRTYSESLSLQCFVWPNNYEWQPIDDFITNNDQSHNLRTCKWEQDRYLIAQGLDVAGEWFGCAGMVIRQTGLNDSKQEFLSEALNTACEQLDNYLHSIRSARQKHQVTMALTRALSNRVLADGLVDAVHILSEAMAVDKLMLVLRSEESVGSPVHVQVYHGAQLTLDTMSKQAKSEDYSVLEEQARAYLLHQDPALVTHFGFASAAEEVLVSGVKEASLVGKVLVTSSSGDFNTHDRELLTGFADFIRQRVVDFNKEYKTLARSFSPATVNRMLRTRDYTEQYLEPREENVAMLYVDISGFTRLCEQTLEGPRQIGQLVDLWSERAVEILWKYQGVFDKMVGDCIIGLFGPPFYEEDLGTRLEHALLAALEIRAMTNSLPDEERFSVLRAGGLGVSSGVNLAPLFVGRFGPNENITGFSSGMNNTARLQGLAEKDEIVVMDDPLKHLAPSRFSFGPIRHANVKNVSKAIAYRPLLSPLGESKVEL